MRRSCSESGIVTCRPRIKIPGSATGSAVCSISFTMDQDFSHKQGTNSGQCWHELFQNPVVVTGYPIPRRTRYSSGLEIPLNVMSGLTESPRMNKYFGRLFLKGFATALVPTEKLNDAVLWHLYYSEDGTRLPYPDLEAIDNFDLDLRDLTKKRHIVGWCSKANFFAGTS